MVNNYRPGDQLYFFGYSRGAYAARALAGLLHLHGVIRPQHENMVRYLWQNYSNNTKVFEEDSKNPIFDNAETYRTLFSTVESEPVQSVPIEMIGVFDTVSSYIKRLQFRTLPYTSQLVDVRTVRHAVAINERRAFFPSNRITPVSTDHREVWFAGVHSDVGGGRPNNQSGLAKVPLKWMLAEAHAAGLRFDPATVCKELQGLNPLAQRSESMSCWWFIPGLIPLRKLRFNPRRYDWSWPNLIRRRTIPEGAYVHHSVRERMAQTGAEAVRLPAKFLWEESTEFPCSLDGC